MAGAGFCKTAFSWILPVLLLAGAGPLAWAGQDAAHHWAGPGSAGSHLETDHKIKTALVKPGNPLKAYLDFKARIKNDYGLDFGLDYHALFQAASDSLGESTAASGALRIFGTWTLVDRGGKNSGSLVYKLENRRLLGTEVAPQQFGGQVGYAGLTAVPFSDHGWMLTNLFWQQALLDQKISLLAGVVDVTDYVDTYAFVDPWTAFDNLAFSNGPTIPSPNQGLGLTVRFLAAGHFYLAAGLADANGDPSEPNEFFSSFFDTSEYFSHVELGWIASQAQRYSDNIHITAWHADARQKAGIKSGWGLSFSLARLLAKKWEPFVRAGYAHEGGALWSHALAAGVGYHPGRPGDLIALGLSWGRPSQGTPGPDLGDQYTAELFYRIQLLPVLAITPDVQLLINPALNQDQDVIAIFGLRAHLGF